MKNYIKILLLILTTHVSSQNYVTTCRETSNDSISSSNITFYRNAKNSKRFKTIATKTLHLDMTRNVNIDIDVSYYCNNNVQLSIEIELNGKSMSIQTTETNDESLRFSIDTTLERGRHLIDIRAKTLNGNKDDKIELNGAFNVALIEASI